MKLNCTNRFLLFIFLIATHFIYARFDPVVFDQIAAQFGNKMANLMELVKITDELNKRGIGRFAVPAFFGISHNEIRVHLQKVPYSENQSVAKYIDEQWEQFKNVQPQGSTTLKSAAQPILKNIRDAIEQAFDPGKNPFFIEGARQKELDEFANQIKSQNKLLMVRSTGREDSKELANAGGNESVSSVPPEIKEITNAIGEVVASYFSEKSLGQRLLAKDKTIFTQEPFMPVLLQIMIGEKVGGAAQIKDIPVSGVMFSQEAEGRTPGVAHIQATWGHNEGVVNGLVPVDSFYVGPSKLIHPIVRIKRNRLVTIAKNGKNVLERKANPRSMQRVQCLMPQDIEQLKNGADAIVAHYNQGPYDIEFVLLNGVINWVQARPITHKDIAPSYLKDEFVKQLKNEEKQSIYVIGAGGGKTHIIKNEQAVIISDNIRDALSIFLKREDKDDVRAIIVGEMAPATSHEATTFRSEVLPALYSVNNNVGLLKTWVKKVGIQNMLIDPQRELITLFNSSDAFKTPQDTIKDGWFTHPIPKKVSVLSEFYLGKPKLVAPRKAEQPSQLMAMIKKVRTSQLIVLIKNSTNKQEVENALIAILSRTADAIEKQKEKKAVNPQLLRNVKNVLNYLEHSAFEILQAFDKWNASAKTESDRIQRLYPIVFFGALIKQKPAPREFVNDYSLSSLIKIELIEQQLVAQLELTETKWKEYLVQYAKAVDVALTAQLKNKWFTFVKQLKDIPDAQQMPFAQMMLTVGTLELMPLFLNLSFAQAHQRQGGNTQKIVQSLQDEFQASKEFIKQLQEKAQQLNEINMANWGEPDKFPKQWQQFQTDILSYFISDKFIRAFKSAQSIGKNGAAAVMNKLVDTFDLSIKTLQVQQVNFDESA